MNMFFVFFFKQKTAYEMRISDWSSDVCSSDLWEVFLLAGEQEDFPLETRRRRVATLFLPAQDLPVQVVRSRIGLFQRLLGAARIIVGQGDVDLAGIGMHCDPLRPRSEEHTSELQSLMRISYDVFCLKQKIHTQTSSNKQ